MNGAGVVRRIGGRRPVDVASEGRVLTTTFRPTSAPFAVAGTVTRRSRRLSQCDRAPRALGQRRDRHPPTQQPVVEQLVRPRLELRVGAERRAQQLNAVTAIGEEVCDAQRLDVVLTGDHDHARTSRASITCAPSFGANLVLVITYAMLTGSGQGAKRPLTRPDRFRAWLPEAKGE